MTTDFNLDSCVPIDAENIEKLPDFSYNFVHSLHLATPHKEGALIGDAVKYARTKDVYDQTAYLLKMVRKIKPNNILEIGTHCCNFDYIMGCLAKDMNCKFKIDTVGLQEASQLCANMVNEEIGNNNIEISFFHGNSHNVLKQDHFRNSNYNLCWVDGDHSFQGALEDLMDCESIGIPHLLVDDCDMPPVMQAVNVFVNRSDYELVEINDDVHLITYLRHESAA